MTDSLSRRHEAGYDILRILAYILVCVQHAMPDNLTQVLGKLPDTYIGFLTEPGVPIFFIISGAFTIGGHTGGRAFFTRKFMRICVPLIVFSLIYMVRGSLLYGGFKHTLARVPFVPADGAFWFLYTLLGLYLITPVLSRWVAAASRREMRAYLLLWLLTTLTPYYCHVLQMQDVRQSSIIYYVSGWIGLYVLGYYLRRFKVYASRRALGGAVVAVCIALMMPWLDRTLGLPYIGIWIHDIGNVLLSVGVTVIVLHMADGHYSSKGLKLSAALTFGGYLIYGLVADELRAYHLTAELHPIAKMLIDTVIVVLVSAILTWIISRIPVLRKAIGM